MDNKFFEHPILNSPYEYPAQHWELDEHGQPTQKIIEARRPADFITPIPKPKKRKQSSRQQEMIFDEGKGLSTEEQQYIITSMINAVRQQVDRWRAWSHLNSPILYFSPFLLAVVVRGKTPLISPPIL